jgi:hypothetical protein
LQVVNARPARLAVEQRQQFTDPADRDARRMDSFGLSIQDGRELLLQIKNLCMKQRCGCDSFQHRFTPPDGRMRGSLTVFGGSCHLAGNTRTDMSLLVNSRGSQSRSG